MIRRGVLIAGGLLVVLGVVLVAWPAALTQATIAVQRTLAGLLPSSGATLPSVINVHVPSGGPRPTQSGLAGQPGASPGPTPVPSASPPYGGPTVISPPVYTYPSPLPSAEGGGGGGGGGGGDRRGRPSPSPGGGHG